MINYIQQLLPRLREFSSQLDKKELFVDKLFTLLQPNNEVHQYTFNRDGRLFLAKNGKTTEGTWELLTTGQLLVNRGVDDRLTLDFDFLHPYVLIMKLGGTLDNPFIIYRQDRIENGNVLKFLQIFNAKKRGEKVYELPSSIINQSELENIIRDENGEVFTGMIYSLPYKYYLYSERVRNVKKIKNGIIWEEFYEVKYPAYNHSFDHIVIMQKDIYTIQLGDKLVDFGPISRPDQKITEIFIRVHNYNAHFDDKNEIVSLKKDKMGDIVVRILFAALIILFTIYIIAKAA